MSEHKARAFLSLSHGARGLIDEMRTAPAPKRVAYGSVRLERGRDAIQFLDARASVTGRVLLESGSTEAQSLEGRPLAMYASLRLGDRSRLGLLNSRHLAAPHSAKEAPMSGRNERRESS